MRRLVVQHRLRFIREGLACLAADLPNFSVAGCCQQPAELQELVVAKAATDVLLEFDEPLNEITSAIGRVLARSEQAPRLVGVTQRVRPDLARAAKDAGLFSVVPVTEGWSGIADTLRPDAQTTVALDDVVVHGPQLTARELQVLEELSAGHTALDISERLGISAHTVNVHKQRLFSKLGVRGQAHAVAVSLRSGLLARWMSDDSP